MLRHTHAEMPFSTAVVVDKFEEPDEGGLLRLYCSILVERESQKPIVIGRRGDMIRTIGTAARLELERFFDARVFLDLHVKVKGEWREDDRVLDEMMNEASLVDRASSGPLDDPSFRSGNQCHNHRQRGEDS